MESAQVKAFVDGITAAVIGALVGAVIVIVIRTIKDIPTALIALATIVILRNNESRGAAYHLVAAIIGLLINFRK